MPPLYRTHPAHAHTQLTHGSRTASTGRVGVTDTTPRGWLLMGPTGKLASRAVRVRLCSVGACFRFLTVTYFYRQGVFLSISYLLYMSCAQIHLPGRTPDGRCIPRCSRRQAGRWLARRHGLAFPAVCRHGLKRYLRIRKH